VRYVFVFSPSSKKKKNGHWEDWRNISIAHPHYFMNSFENKFVKMLIFILHIFPSFIPTKIYLWKKFLWWKGFSYLPIWLDTMVYYVLSLVQRICAMARYLLVSKLSTTKRRRQAYYFIINKVGIIINT